MWYIKYVRLFLPAVLRTYNAGLSFALLLLLRTHCSNTAIFVEFHNASAENTAIFVEFHHASAVKFHGMRVVAGSLAFSKLHERALLSIQVVLLGTY
jgi:hypothetical protein